jgi:hypothetical protein
MKRPKRQPPPAQPPPQPLLDAFDDLDVGKMVEDAFADFDFEKMMDEFFDELLAEPLFEDLPEVEPIEDWWERALAEKAVSDAAFEAELASGAFDPSFELPLLDFDAPSPRRRRRLRKPRSRK